MDRKCSFFYLLTSGTGGETVQGVVLRTGESPAIIGFCANRRSLFPDRKLTRSLKLDLTLVYRVPAIYPREPWYETEWVRLRVADSPDTSEPNCLALHGGLWEQLERIPLQRPKLRSEVSSFNVFLFVWVYIVYESLSQQLVSVLIYYILNPAWLKPPHSVRFNKKICCLIQPLC